MRFSSRWWHVGLILLSIPIAVTAWSLSNLSGRASAAESVRIVVSLSDRTLRLVEGGKTVKTYPIAIGQPSNPTPKGSFSIRRIVWNPTWVPPNSEWARGKRPRAAGEPGNPMQGVKLYFRDPAYYIHGTNDPASIGSAASRGCIRMRKADAEDLARRLMERAGAGRSESWYRNVIASNRTTEVRLPRAVPMVIRG